MGRGCLEAAILYCRYERQGRDQDLQYKRTSHSLAVVKIVLRSYLEKESLDVVSRRLLLEILSDRNDYLQIVDLFPPEKKEKIISKLLVLPR